MTSATLPAIAVDDLGFFRWGRIGDAVLATTDGGDWAILTEAEFAQLLAGEIKDGHPRFAQLHAGGFLRENLDLGALATRLARRIGHVARGPERHVVTMTRRDGGSAVDLGRETAERIIDLALQSSAPAIWFEFQGLAADPLQHLDGIRHFVDYARSANRRAAGKKLSFTLVSNLSHLTEETAEWLVANDVVVRTWLDGPAALHDANRQWTQAGAHADVVRWIEWFHRRYRELGRDPERWQVDVRMTATKASLSAWQEIVNEYAAWGVRTLHLQALSPLGLSPETWAAIGYSAEEYVAFYERALAYLIELNRGGGDVAEGTASAILNKILTTGDPSVGAIRSPCVAGTSEVAYDVDGRVFPGDEARRIDAAGDPIFALGNVRELKFADVVRHPTVRAIAAASVLDAQPMCADCWNKPFCGFSPVSTYVRNGDLFGQRPHCFECKEHMAISRALFGLLAKDDAQAGEILQRWATGAMRSA